MKMTFMIEPMPAIAGRTLSKQPKIKTNSKSLEILRLRQDVEAYDSSTHRGEDEAHHGCYRKFCTAWHCDTKPAQDRCNCQRRGRCGPSAKHQKCRACDQRHSDTRCVTQSNGKFPAIRQAVAAR